MSSSPRSHWERPDPKDRQPFRFTERDRQILVAVYRHRFLQPHLLHALLSGSAQKINLRCRLLWQWGYLERPKAQRPTRALTEEIVYALGKQGAHELDRLDPRLRLGKRDWTDEPKKQRTYNYVDHQLEVARFFVALQIACNRQKHRLHWNGQTARNEYRIPVPGKDESKLHDGFFTLERGYDGHKALYFLELERTKKTLEEMREKLNNYYLWWKSEWAGRTAGPRGFRVLVLSTDPDDVASQRRLALPIGRSEHDGMQHETWKGFLFADMSIVDLANPERILEPIFRTADDEKLISLLG